MNADGQRQVASLPEPNGKSSARMMLSIVSPAYNEAENLPLLYGWLCQVLGSTDVDREWSIIDDHLSDATFAVATDISKREFTIF